LPARPLIVVLLAASLFAQSPLEQAVTLTRQKRYAEAAQLLEGIAEPAPTPQRIAFHRLKAAVASGLNHSVDAAEEMNAALALAPHDQQLLVATLVAEKQAKLFDAALHHASQLPESAPRQALIGDIQEERGEYVEAAKAYQAAIALAPEIEEYRLRLALEFAQHHTFEPAIAVLQEGTGLFPKSARIWTLLGITQYAVRQVDYALTSLTTAVELDPSLDNAREYLSVVVLETQSTPPDRTIAVLCRSTSAVCGAVQLRQSREQNDPALRAQAIEQLKKAPRDDATARCELGRAYEWSADWPEARREMEACIALAPSAQNHYRLGLIYRALKLPDLASKEMKLREEAVAKTTDENARRTNAVQAFQYVLK